MDDEPAGLVPVQHMAACGLARVLLLARYGFVLWDGSTVRMEGNPAARKQVKRMKRCF